MTPFVSHFQTRQLELIQEELANVPDNLERTPNSSKIAYIQVGKLEFVFFKTEKEFYNYQKFCLKKLSKALLQKTPSEVQKLGQNDEQNKHSIPLNTMSSQIAANGLSVDRRLSISQGDLSNAPISSFSLTFTSNNTFTGEPTNVEGNWGPTEEESDTIQLKPMPEKKTENLAPDSEGMTEQFASTSINIEQTEMPYHLRKNSSLEGFASKFDVFHDHSYEKIQGGDSSDSEATLTASETEEMGITRDSKEYPSLAPKAANP